MLQLQGNGKIGIAGNASDLILMNFAFREIPCLCCSNGKLCIRCDSRSHQRNFEISQRVDGIGTEKGWEFRFSF
jgi:hypothetical protein